MFTTLLTVAEEELIPAVADNPVIYNWAKKGNKMNGICVHCFSEPFQSVKKTWQRRNVEMLKKNTKKNVFVT